MAIFPIKHYRKQAGLTLIEVLIALAIVAIALTAIIKASSQSIRSTTYLQTKSIALWAGQQALNEARLGVVKLSSGEPVKQTIPILDRTMYLGISLEETPNKHIKKLIVKVFDHEVDEEDESPVVTLESYLYGAAHG